MNENKYFRYISKISTEGDFTVLVACHSTSHVNDPDYEINLRKTYNFSRAQIEVIKKSLLLKKTQNKIYLHEINTDIRFPVNGYYRLAKELRKYINIKDVHLIDFSNINDFSVINNLNFKHWENLLDNYYDFIVEIH